MTKKERNTLAHGGQHQRIHVKSFLAVEENGKKLVLEADGPDMQDPNKPTR